MASSAYFKISKKRLLKNLTIAKELKEAAGIELYFTLKALNCTSTIKLIAKELDGFSVSSKAEEKLAKEVGAKKINFYSIALEQFNIKKIDRVSFNSITQYTKFKNTHTNVGIRVNPNITISESCNYTQSHLGVDYKELLKYENSNMLKELKGLHFHIMFNANLKDLNRLLEHVLATYKPLLKRLEWINLGGGYNITEFKKKEFKKIIANFKTRYPHITIILEPGEGLLKDIGTLNCKIIDITQGNIIVNTSTQTHMLDIAMVSKHYNIKENSKDGKHSYKIYGNSCISNDYFGKYTFKNKPKIGDKITFLDAISYTTTKQTNFTLAKQAKIVQ